MVGLSLKLEKSLGRILLLSFGTGTDIECRIGCSVWYPPNVVSNFSNHQFCQKGKDLTAWFEVVIHMFDFPGYSGYS